MGGHATPLIYVNAILANSDYLPDLALVQDGSDLADGLLCCAHDFIIPLECVLSS
jgi:hypothetical protein